MTEDICARIEILSPRFTKMAEYYAKGTYQTAEDLYQSMIVHLLERQAADHNFCRQKDSYILDAGRKKVCWPALRRAAVENKYTTGEPEIKLDDENNDNFFDTFASPEVEPETACENLEQALALAEVIREHLSGREREVLSLVVKGVSTSEIASAFGISSSAVSVYKRRVAAKLRTAVAV